MRKSQIKRNRVRKITLSPERALELYAQRRANPKRLKKQARITIEFLRTVSLVIGALNNEKHKHILQMLGLQEVRDQFAREMVLGMGNMAAACSDWLNYDPQGKNWPYE